MTEKVTKADIPYKPFPYLWTATIPAGTKVIRATNLPGESYWAEPWENMTPEELGWQQGYGFRLTSDEVTTRRNES